jgi:hypothetical protein
MKIVSILLVALVTAGSSGAAFAGSSPFCFGGSPVPKHICDLLKAHEKNKPTTLVNATGILADSGSPQNPPSALGRPVRR